MPRPHKCRFVESSPGAACFVPLGVPAGQLQEVSLALDEFEALRLADHEGLHLDHAAARLGVSRATCARILDQARRTVASALVGGRALRIGGGEVLLGPRGGRCGRCHRRLDGEKHCACPRFGQTPAPE